MCIYRKYVQCIPGSSKHVAGDCITNPAVRTVVIDRRRSLACCETHTDHFKTSAYHHVKSTRVLKCCVTKFTVVKEFEINEILDSWCWLRYCKSTAVYIISSSAVYGVKYVWVGQVTPPSRPLNTPPPVASRRVSVSTEIDFPPHRRRRRQEINL